MLGNDRPVPARPSSSPAEPLRAKLSDADDRIRLNHWMPPQNGIAPRIRIGRRWINTLWGLPIAAILTIAWLLASPFTIRHARLVQRAGGFMIGWIMGLAESWDARSQLTKHDISPYFWPNGTMPDAEATPRSDVEPGAPSSAAVLPR